MALKENYKVITFTTDNKRYCLRYRKTERNKNNLFLPPFENFTDRKMNFIPVKMARRYVK